MSTIEKHRAFIESEQAQAIVQIELAIKLRRGRVVNDEEFALKKMVVQLLEIVDSQAQKIAEQAQEIERLKYKIRAADLRGANE